MKYAILTPDGLTLFTGASMATIGTILNVHEAAEARAIVECDTIGQCVWHRNGKQWPWTYSHVTIIPA